MKKTSELKTIAVDLLKPAEYNPRKQLKPGDKEYEKIKNSITEFGFTDPLVVNSDMTIIGGHQRLSVAKDLGYTEVPCAVVELDKTREKALNIALNKITGAWDDSLLADLLVDLQNENFNTDFTGFEAPEIDMLFSKVHDKNVKEDDFDIDEAIEETPFVENGDIWHLGKHRLMCGDSTNAIDVSKLLDGVKANLCVTDPPYNCSYEGGTGMKIMNDSWKDSKEFYSFLLSAFKNVYDNLADGGAIYIFHSDAEKVNFFNATVDAGFHYSTTCIWVKDSLVLGRADYQMQHEPIIYAFKDTAKHKWYSDRKQTTIWNFDRPTKSKLHPTTKPIPLISYPIKNSSQVNGVVLDLFGGSGSTLIACEQLDRIAYLMELDPKYATVIVKRYLKFFEDSGEKAKEIYVIRDGQKLTLDEVLQDMEG
ncbi:MAG: DNA modification methylase [Firmicutes bacterium]|nr:DNA modification methylase [Bacillota bacterium]